MERERERVNVVDKTSTIYIHLNLKQYSWLLITKKAAAGATRVLSGIFGEVKFNFCSSILVLELTIG